MAPRRWRLLDGVTEMEVVGWRHRDGGCWMAVERASSLENQRQTRQGLWRMEGEGCWEDRSEELAD